MSMELKLDKLLNIYTRDSIITYADKDHNIYQPTPYEILDRLLSSNIIHYDDTVVDFGCGRGRIAFYLSYFIGCSVIGIERIPEIYKRAINNLETYIGNTSDIDFLCMDAENFDIKDESVFFFFNPFSAKIFDVVLSNIIKSYKDNPRDVRIVFFDMDKSYVPIIEKYQEIKHSKYIDCSDLYDDVNKGISIFNLTLE